MPKVNKRRLPQDEPIDWLWAAYLERMKSCGITLQDISKVAGVEYSTMRKYNMYSPWGWPRSVRERVCDALAIKIAYTPKQDNTIEVNVG